jgi:hypothetical protein
MASVFVLSAASSDSADPKAFIDREQMLADARVDRFGIHKVTDDPSDADLVLFVETSTAAGAYFDRIKTHPVYREFREKSYLFSSTDRFIPFLPGVYASIERRWYREAWTRAGHYLGVKERGEMRYEPGFSPSRLFSFIGASNTSSLRERVIALRHPDAVVIDSHAESLAIKRGERPPLAQEEFVRRYVHSVRESAFVLCPRGGGPSSFRLFETMMLGRAPVVISDQWVPPEGPDWGSFSLRIAERDIEKIPQLLEANRGDAEAMGGRARAAWLKWFSDEVSFHRTVERCLDLEKWAPKRAGLRQFSPYLQMMRPYHAARYAAKRIGAG